MVQCILHADCMNMYSAIYSAVHKIFGWIHRLRLQVHEDVIRITSSELRNTEREGDGPPGGN